MRIIDIMNKIIVCLFKRGIFFKASPSVDIFSKIDLLSTGGFNPLKNNPFFAKDYIFILLIKKIKEINFWIFFRGTVMQGDALKVGPSEKYLFFFEISCIEVFPIALATRV